MCMTPVLWQCVVCNEQLTIESDGVNLAVDVHSQVDPPQSSVVFSGGRTGVQEALLGGTELAIAQALDLYNRVTDASSPVGHHFRHWVVAGLGESTPQINSGGIAELVALQIDVQTLAEVGITNEVSNGADNGGTYSVSVRT